MLNILNLIKIIIISIIILCFLLGFIKTYNLTSVGIAKALNYDDSVSNVRQTYQSKIDEMLIENETLKNQILEKDNLITIQSDKLFLYEKELQELHNTVKRLLSNGATKTF